MENLQVHPRNAATSAPVPETLGTECGQPLEALIPEPEMHFDRERDLRVEEVAAPLPSGVAYEGGEMVSRSVLHAGHGFVTAARQHPPRCLHGLRRQPEIDVVLDAARRRRTEQCAMGKA